MSRLPDPQEPARARIRLAPQPPPRPTCCTERSPL